MSDEKSSYSQDENNIRSPKQKEPGKTWTKEDMEKAEPYPLPEVPAKEKIKKKTEKRSL